MKGEGGEAPTTGAARGSIRVFAPLADDYAAGRPEYPATVFDALMERVRGVARGRVVLDVAAGTGAATRGLLGRGLLVGAVEPAPEMLRAAIGRIPGDPGWLGGVAARAEALAIRDASAAAIVVAQAFHWLDPEPALDEFARVLVPGGVLLLLWNVTEANPFSTRVWELVERFNPGHKRPVTELMRGTPEALAARSDFRPELPLEVDHFRRLPVDEYLRYARSWSYVGGAMDPSTQAEFLRRLERLVATHHGDAPVEERFQAVGHFARRV